MTIPVKLTRAHQVTLPKRLLQQAGWLKQEYFVADLKGGVLLLKPLQMGSRPPLASFEDLRRHFARIGIRQRDVDDAVAWARSRARPASRPRRAHS